MNTPNTFELNIAIPKILFSSVLQKPELLLELMGEEQKQNLKEYLFDQLQDKDGSPEIDEMRIHALKYQEENGQGSFRLHFMINRRFCCSDIEACRTDYVDFKFEYLQEDFRATAHYFNWELNN